MVMYALAAMLLPAVALAAGHIDMNSGQNMNNMNMGQQWANSGWGNSGWGVQMQGQMNQMQQGNNQWWAMDDQEDYEEYLKWCEERRLAIQEQEEQQKLLREMQEHAEEKKREMEREAVMKAMKAKRESMMNQWKQWQAQMAMADMFDGAMDKYTEMKIKYMFGLTMDFLKFCRCSDYASHLQRYLVHGDMSYQPEVNEAFSVDDLEGIDIANVEAVAQRLASLPEADGIKLYFGGAIDSMCTAVKTYVDQVKGWEAQYNFLGM